MDETVPTKQFLDVLHRGGNWAFLWKPNTPKGHLTYWYRVAKGLPPFHNKSDVYFGVNPCAEIPTHNSKGEPTPAKYVRSQIPIVQGQNCLYSEFDARDYGDKAEIRAHLDTLPFSPSVIIDSGGGYHAYWILSEFCEFAANADREKAKYRQWAWVEFTGGDRGSKCLTRVLRIPATLNTKYTPPRHVSFAKIDLSITYQWQQIDSVIADIVTRLHTAVERNHRRGNGPTLDGKRLTKYVKATIVGILDKVQSAENGSRNSLLHWAACRLGELAATNWAGLDMAQAFDLLFQVSPLKDGESKATIQSGLNKGAQNPAEQPRYNMEQPL